MTLIQRTVENLQCQGRCLSTLQEAFMTQTDEIYRERNVLVLLQSILSVTEEARREEAVLLILE